VAAAAVSNPNQGSLNADANALLQVSPNITWAQMVGLLAMSANQSSGGLDEVQQGTNPDTGTPYAVGQSNAGFGPWQVTPWNVGNGTQNLAVNPPIDGTPNLQNAANAAWAKFNAGLKTGNGFSAWFLNSTGTAVDPNASPEVQQAVANDPGGYIPSPSQWQWAISAANTVMQPPKNYSTPANAAIVAAAGGPNTLNPDTVTDPNIVTAADRAAQAAALAGTPPASTGPGSIMGNCNGNYDYIKFPSVLGIGGGGILTPCNVKALLSFLLIVSGSVLGLAGMLLLFDRSGKLLGKVGGKAAELAGAATAAVPGGEAVGAGVAEAGHQVSKAAGTKAPASQTPRQKSAPAPAPKPRQTSTPSQSDVNSMSSAQKRALVQQHARAGGSVAAS
jgi:hypothetical protein